ncbi:MAG: flavin reductase family protein [Firmicutes bacterium]|nr:flavin reductase family protein [Bacillota bacterium]MCM1401800.1 flavin reductase family protein [Bacteroides sp.]MCM1477681.1 flavin reductase family protein [Bacteroides sp.]
MKQQWKPGTMIYPLPAVLVSCGSAEHSNLVTVAWTGTVCTDPAMCYISLRPERYSHGLIRENMEFTINLTTQAMARATDWCGVKSGRDFDKWAETGLTPEPGKMVSCPSVKESPVSIECRVRRIEHLGSHDMFLAEVLCVLADEELLDSETGAFLLDKAGLMSYSHGQYFSQGEPLGRFGWSVMKKRTKQKLKNQ